MREPIRRSDRCDRCGAFRESFSGLLTQPISQVDMYGGHEAMKLLQCERCGERAGYQTELLEYRAILCLRCCYEWMDAYLNNWNAMVLRADVDVRMQDLRAAHAATQPLSERQVKLVRQGLEDATTARHEVAEMLWGLTRSFILDGREEIDLNTNTKGIEGRLAVLERASEGGSR